MTFERMYPMNKKRLLSILTVIIIAMSLVTFVFATGDASAVAETGEPAPWYAGLLNSGILPIIIIVLVFYFVLIRPENKRKKETANMRDNLKSGDEITTIGGIVGRVTNVRDDEITIETSNDKTKLRLKKWAVSSVDKKKEQPADEEA